MAVFHVVLCTWIILISHLISAVSPSQKTIWQFIQNNNRLREIQNIIERHNLSYLLERNGVTAFVPTTTAFLYFDEMRYGYNMDDPKMAKSFLSYHIAHGIIYQKDMIDNRVTDSIHRSNFKLHFNTFIDGSKVIHTVNGAVLSVVDIQASNGILHIVDRVIAPVASIKTLHDYMLQPEIPKLAFISISRASIVDPTLKEQTNNNNYRFTAFAPNDSFLFPMPNYGQDLLFSDLILLKTVIRAHMMSDYVQFLPSKGHIQSRAAKNGTLHFERRNGEVYVKNNLVRARVVQANIPVSNGVIHVVDNLLYFIYMNIVQKLQSMPETSAFGRYLKDIPLSIQLFLQNKDNKFTVFAPSNDAFAKIPYLEQKGLSSDMHQLSEVLGAHIIPDIKLNEAMMDNNMVFISVSNITVTLFKINGDIYVKSGDVQAKLELTDIPCTNGIIHIIRNVLIMQNFSVWEAIVGSERLKVVASVINNTDIMDVLSTPIDADQSKQVTVFLPGDSAFRKMPVDMRNLLLHSQHAVLVNALRSHVLEGQRISSIDVTSMVLKRTMGGKDIELENLSKGFVAIGSHILAKIVVRDIWCHNGILHVIDDLLHIPTRNILEEMSRYNDLRILSSFFTLPTMINLDSKLRMEEFSFTVFVPVDEAFDSLPRSKADLILGDTPFLEKILKAHVVPNVSLYAEEFLDGDSLLAEEEFIHVVRNTSEVVIINNNVRAKILKSNILATNGKIHVIDSLLYFPYRSVAETMSTDNRFRAFYEMLSSVQEFEDLATVEDKKMTIFVPSTTFLNSIPRQQFEVIRASPEIVKRIFVGHVIPGARLDSMFLRQYLIDNYIIRSKYNTTFEFLEKNTVNTIDVGYSNLRHQLNIIRDGVACSNGILYTIDGFLSWSLHNIMEELKAQASIKYSAEHFMKLLPVGIEKDLMRNESVYTVFIPTDDAFSLLTQWDIAHINTNFNATERELLYNRHIINGTMWTYRDLIHGGNVSDIMADVGVYFVIKNHDVYLHWNNMEAQVIKSNILASNGIIHIIDKIFIKGEKPEVTTKTPHKLPVSAAYTLQCYNSEIVLCLITSFLCLHYLVRR